MKFKYLPIFLLVSCGTYNIDNDGVNLSSDSIKNAIYSGVVCGVIGGALGRKYSPNEESRNANMLVFGGGSATLCAATSAYINLKEENEDSERFITPSFEQEKSNINIETEYK